MAVAGGVSQPSSLSVACSDVEGGQGAVYVGTGSTLTWGSGNIGADPRFVSEITSDYRLKQIAAGQTITSPCVETGSISAVNAGLALYTTRLDEVPDRGIVDMGYHYLVEQPCRFVDVTGILVPRLPAAQRRDPSAASGQHVGRS